MSRPWRLRSRVATPVPAALAVLMTALSGCMVYEHHYRTLDQEGQRVSAWSVSLNTSFQDMRHCEINASTDPATGVLPVFDQFLDVDSLVVILGEHQVHQSLQPQTVTYNWSTGADPPPGATSACDIVYLRPLSSQRCWVRRDHQVITPREKGGSHWSHHVENGEMILDPPCPLRPGTDPWPPTLLDADTTVVELGAVPADSLLAVWPRPERVFLNLSFPSHGYVSDEDRRRFELHVRVVDRRSGRVLETAVCTWDQERFGHWYLWTGE